MSAPRLTRSMIDRTAEIIDRSGVLDLLCPIPEADRTGRRGQIRLNTRLWLIGVILCARLNKETTIIGVHQTLTRAVSRDAQWDFGILRERTSTSTPSNVRELRPVDEPRLTERGKPRKEMWPDLGVERIGYDDLVNVVKRIRSQLDYGYRTAPDIDDEERMRRRLVVEEVTQRLIDVTLIERAGTAVAIDATGLWAWRRGPLAEARRLLKKLKKTKGARPSGDSEDAPALAEAQIGMNEDGDTSPEAPPAKGDADLAPGKLDDAWWGYLTSKWGGISVGFGYHQHTLVWVPSPGMAQGEEPILVCGAVVVPANQDVVSASLDMIDRASAFARITHVIGDLLYSNLKADRWAVPLAQRGIEQVLAMRQDADRVVDIHGGQLQFGWLHCPLAPMHLRPLPARWASEETDENIAAIEKFQDQWAFHRKESGLRKALATKWICPARDGRVGCHAVGEANVRAAIDLELPVYVPPTDWKTRKCCNNKSSVDFTPNPSNPHHQRKLAQTHYYGSRRWREWYSKRTYVEGVFGILKNASRLRIKRGHNRIDGLAIANIVNGLKLALYNEQQLRAWHEDTDRGPSDHYLLQPDPVDWGYTDLTKAQAKAMDAERIAALHQDADLGEAA